MDSFDRRPFYTLFYNRGTIFKSKHNRFFVVPLRAIEYSTAVISKPPNGLCVSHAAPLDRNNLRAESRFQKRSDLADAKRCRLHARVGRASFRNQFHTDRCDQDCKELYRRYSVSFFDLCSVYVLDVEERNFHLGVVGSGTQ